MGGMSGWCTHAPGWRKSGSTLPTSQLPVALSIAAACSVPLSPFFSRAAIAEKRAIYRSDISRRFGRPSLGKLFVVKTMTWTNHRSFPSNWKSPNPVVFFCPGIGPSFPSPLGCLGHHENSSQAIPFPSLFTIHNKQHARTLAPGQSFWLADARADDARRWKIMSAHCVDGSVKLDVFLDLPTTSIISSSIGQPEGQPCHITLQPQVWQYQRGPRRTRRDSVRAVWLPCITAGCEHQ